MAFIEWPDTAHPGLEEYAQAVRGMMARGLWDITYAPRRVSAVMSWPDTGPSVLELRLLHVERATGPAPYVGDPFRYEWKVARDAAGRWIAGPAAIVRMFVK